jgi:hypothetical protein
MGEIKVVVRDRWAKVAHGDSSEKTVWLTTMIQDNMHQTFREGELERIKEEIQNNQEWFARLVELLVRKNLITDEELDENFIGGGFDLLKVLGREGL